MKTRFSCRPLSRERRAFTLVELLVVIAIIGVLVGLLLPAVQAAREAGRRASCLNKIRQVATAAMNFESGAGHFPDGSDNKSQTGYCEDPSGGGNAEVTPGADVNGCNYGPAWTVALLPYLEQESLLNAFDSKDTGFAPMLDQVCPNNRNDTQLMQTPMALWHCPSDPIASTGEGSYVNCYHACSGGGNPNFTNPQVDPNSTCQTEDCNVACRGSAWNNLQNFKNGIFYPTSETKISEIEDGTTNTILIGENRLHYLKGMHGIPTRAAGWASPSIASDVHGCGINMSATANSINETVGGCGALLYTGVTGCGANEVTSYWDYDTTFSSHHPGGAHFAMADASGQFLSEDIDLELYRSLGRRSDGAPLGGLEQ